MSSRENFFEHAASLARGEREHPGTAVVPPSDDREWDYICLDNSSAISRGLAPEEVFDEPSAVTTRDFVEFAEERDFCGSTPLRSRYSSWEGEGYPVPYSQKGGLYLCSDGQLRGGYMNEPGSVVRAEIPRRRSSLHERPSFYTVGHNETWTRVVTFNHPLPGDDGGQLGVARTETVVTGDIRRNYERPSAAEILTTYAIEMDKLGSEVTPLYEMLPGLAQVAFKGVQVLRSQPAAEAIQQGYNPLVSSEGILVPGPGQILGQMQNRPINVWQYTF